MAAPARCGRQAGFSSDAAAISTVLAPGGRLFTVVSLLFGLATIALGGYFAARIRPGAATALATIVMIVIVILFVTMRHSAPLWYGRWLV